MTISSSPTDSGERSASPYLTTSSQHRAVWAAARLGGLILVVLTMTSFIVSLPLYNAQTLWKYTELGANGRVPNLPASTITSLETLVIAGFAATCFSVAAFIAWRKPSQPVALLIAVWLVIEGASFPGTLYLLADVQPAWRVVARLVEVSGLYLMIIVCCMFPDGRWVPRWTRYLVIGGIIWLILHEVLAAVWPRWPRWLGFWETLVWFGTALFAQVYRYRRVSGPVQRHQTKWVVFGFTVMLVSYLGVWFLFASLPGYNQPGTLSAFVNFVVLYLAFLLLPLSFAIAVLRYRLWDIDPIINRTLVYGTLTATIITLYVLVVGSVGALFNARGNLVISLGATGLVAVVFQPLRERSQRIVNRVMYGQRDDPYAVLSRLGQRVEATLAADAVLPTIVETVQEALKLPYVAIALATDTASVKGQGPVDPSHPQQTPSVVAAVGDPSSAIHSVPLVYQHENVGALLLTPRAPDEPFSPADRRLLADLARQAGIAIHALRLSRDLQHSRERLVTAREEERRRLRRDLHDGLGPTLASLIMKLDTAQTLVVADPPVGVALLGEIQAQMKETISTIRRLVYALRPPALDQWGLVAAIREHAVQLKTGAVHMEIEAPDHLPPLPAAVEVAAYYIAIEALTNVTRHAQAHHCTVRLHVAEILELEVVDDGRGLPAEHRTGVGLQSMRERAAELGGTCVIEVLQPAGLRVRAMLPLYSA